MAEGQFIRRVELHDKVGGQRQGGIGPSAVTPNVLVFTEPKTGAKYGYRDHWEGQVLHYTGEGQVGDQEMTHGNRAIRDHREEGRRLRLFKGVRGTVEYLGEYETELDDAWYWDTADDRTGAARKVIVFRLRPAAQRSTELSVESHRPSGSHQLRETSARFGVLAVDADESRAVRPGEPFSPDPSLVDRGTQGHARTQNALKRFLEQRGIRPLAPDRSADDPDFDLGWIRNGIWYVVEVKSLTDKNEAKQLRLALGQVLDYQDRLLMRHDDVRAVIAVERPVADRRWVALCERHHVALVWPDTFEIVLSRVLTA